MLFNSLKWLPTCGRETILCDPNSYENLGNYRNFDELSQILTENGPRFKKNIGLRTKDQLRLDVLVLLCKKTLCSWSQASIFAKLYT